MRKNWCYRIILGCTFAFSSIPMMAKAQTYQGEIIDAKPCPKADLFISASGQRFELLPSQTEGISGKVRLHGLIYPKASICKIYPWMRVWDLQPLSGSSSVKPDNEQRPKQQKMARLTLRKATRIDVYGEANDLLPPLRQAVSLQRSLPHAKVSLLIVDGNMESLAHAAVLMKQQNIPFPKGFQITMAKAGSPQQGVLVHWHSGEKRYFRSFNALVRYENLG